MQQPHPHGMSGLSFDARAASFPSSQTPGNQMMYAQQSQPVMNTYRSASFTDVNHGSHSQPHMHQQQQPQIYTAVYSGVSVYEMEVNDVAVMRRRSDSWLNATQILKVAGVDKGKRTKVLEKEIRHGEHEKAQGGYGKYQGTWIPYRRGREFCRQYGVEDLLRPLLDYDMSTDGSGQPGQGIDTPTKEQAMAANRKRLYSQTHDGRQSQASQGGTFFSNLSSTASNAISAMTKAARLNTPHQRPASAPRRASSVVQGSVQNSQQSFMAGPSSQRSVPALPNERSFSAADSAYMTQGIDQAPLDSQEPPRKRIRGDGPYSSQTNGNISASMREGTPTEPNDSFFYHPSSQHVTADGDVPVALPPLPHPSDKRAEEKQSLLLDLFADQTRAEFSTHPAIIHLSGADLDLPLDQSANTALHWAATLARVPLMRLLIAKGANIFRGNIAGETALMAAVQVNNNSDHGCFPDLLDILAQTLEIRDSKGRTILHHIAVASGIKGRSGSSKYYLEALLEFLVRGTSTNILPPSSLDGSSLTPKPIGLMRFMSEMVNARDISGNTALNLVARIGNRSIIRQLIEVQADPTIPNHKGLRPIDFGVEPKEAESADPASQAAAASSSQSKGPSKADEVTRELGPLLNGSISEVQTKFVTELGSLQERGDGTTSTIRDLSVQQKALSDRAELGQARLRGRQERKQRIHNLHRAINEMRERILTGSSKGSNGLAVVSGDADATFAVPLPSVTANEAGLAGVPDGPTLNARVGAYNALNSGLLGHLTGLKARDTELEAKYRKVIALCTKVPEGKVDVLLPQLLLAVESEPENDVGRVREFLKRVEAVNAP